MINSVSIDRRSRLFYRGGGFRIRIGKRDMINSVSR